MVLIHTVEKGRLRAFFWYIGCMAQFLLLTLVMLLQRSGIFSFENLKIWLTMADATSDASTESETSQQPTNDGYTPIKTWHKEVKYVGTSGKTFQHQYKPMTIEEEEQHSAKFTLPSCVPPTIYTLTMLFLPDRLINRIVKHSNEYGHWKSSSFKEITATEVFFLQLYFTWVWWDYLWRGTTRTLKACGYHISLCSTWSSIGLNRYGSICI